MYDSSIAFNDAELKLIADNGVDIAKLRDFWSRFPDQDIETAIGGLKMELDTVAAGETPAISSSIDETVE